MKESVEFVNGMLSWSHTYGVMCDYTRDINHGFSGRIAFLEQLTKWAFEFEEEYKNTDWEETQWDETLETFLIKKL